MPVETLVHQNQYGHRYALGLSEEGNDAAVFVKFVLDAIEFSLNAAADCISEIGEPVNETGVRTLRGPSLNGGLTYDELSEIPSVNRSTVNRNIRLLKGTGLIGRKGSDRKGSWEATPEAERDDFRRAPSSPIPVGPDMFRSQK